MKRPVAVCVGVCVVAAAGLELYEKRLRAQPVAIEAGAAPVTDARPAEPACVGVLTSANAVDVTPSEAASVEKLWVTLGQKVEAGTPLVQLQSPELTAEALAVAARLKAAEAAVATARVQLRQAAQAAKSAKMVRDYISAMELKNHELSVDEKKGLLAAAVARRDERAAEKARHALKLGALTLRAPRAGEVAELYVRPGAFVAAGKPALRLAVSGAPVVRFAIPPAQLGKLAVGSRLKVSQRSVTAEAVVSRVQPDFDPALGHQLAEAELVTDASGIVPGLPLSLVLEPAPEAPALRAAVTGGSDVL